MEKKILRAIAAAWRWLRDRLLILLAGRDVVAINVHIANGALTLAAADRALLVKCKFSSSGGRAALVMDGKPIDAAGLKGEILQ